jgi:protein phosphatase 1G
MIENENADTPIINLNNCLYIDINSCIGGLNLSRAIGDHAYKKTSSLLPEEQAITALPDIRTLTLEDQDEFMVIACDGIWNFMSSQDVVDFVRLRLDKKSLSQICEEVCFFSKNTNSQFPCFCSFSYLCIVLHPIHVVMVLVVII